MGTPHRGLVTGLPRHLAPRGRRENPKVVSERLGHASVTLTLDTYTHVLPNMQRRATDKLEEMLFGSVTATGR